VLSSRALIDIVTSPCSCPVDSPEESWRTSAGGRHLVSRNLASGLWNSGTLVVPALTFAKWIWVRVAVETAVEVLADFVDAAAVERLVSAFVDVLASWVSTGKGGLDVGSSIAASAGVDGLVSSVNSAKVTDSTWIGGIHNVETTEVQWVVIHVAFGNLADLFDAPSGGTESRAGDFINTFSSGRIVGVVKWADAASDVGIHVADGGTDGGIEIASVSAADEVGEINSSHALVGSNVVDADVASVGASSGIHRALVLILAGSS
jgi:hypothetical protein